MVLLMRKDTRLNIRITPEFRTEIEELADYHGLTMSSYVHSVLVKAIRREHQHLTAELPIVNRSEPRANGNVVPAKGMKVINARSMGEMTDERKTQKRRKKKKA